MINPISINQLQEGDKGIIHSIEGDSSLTSRLAGMGIATNAKFKIVQVSGRLVIVQVADTRIALGQDEAAKIMVDNRNAACEPPVEKEIFVALAGQPNVGKSTVFNILTGLSQHVGNWPGKTVEKKEGFHRTANTLIRIVDLPGTYSLTAFSEEERVAREFIIQEKPDLVVLVLNAAALERSLYLLSEVLLLARPVIVALNMLDVASGQGMHIDMHALQKALGIPVIPMIAKRNSGIKELMTQINAFAAGDIKLHPHLPEVSADHMTVYEKILEQVRPYCIAPYTPQWLTVKLMEGDPDVSKQMEAQLPADSWKKILALFIEHEDSLHAVVNGRYDWIEQISRVALSRFKMGQVVITDRIDHILTQPVFGIPILLAVMAFVFSLTYSIGMPLQNWLAGLIHQFTHWCEPLFIGLPVWFKGLFLNGIIGGTGSVITFLPILIIFFVTMALLEDIGYMARAAFVMDRIMHLVGLHGKSFIPICLGFGCNVPAVLGARMIETRKARMITRLLIPFVPCTARLAVLTLVSAAIFGPIAPYVSWSILVLNIVALGIAGIFVNKTIWKQDAPFIMELPIYHRPDLRTIMMVVWSRTISFVRKAGTVILGVSILIWFLSYYPSGIVEESWLAYLGKLLEPVGEPLGLSWKMIAALLTGLVAKENIIATLSVLYSVGSEGLVHLLPQIMSHASAAAFLVVMMLFIPCAGTIAVLKKEMNSSRWFYSTILLTLLASYFGGVLAFNFVKWLGI